MCNIIVYCYTALSYRHIHTHMHTRTRTHTAGDRIICKMHDELTMVDTCRYIGMYILKEFAVRTQYVQILRCVQ